MADPKPTHWIATKKVLRYLSGTQRYGIDHNQVKDLEVSGFCDADTVDRRSQAGFMVYVGNTLVSWSSKKQDTIARSSTESEYRVIAVMVQEL